MRRCEPRKRRRRRSSQLYPLPPFFSTHWRVRGRWRCLATEHLLLAISDESVEGGFRPQQLSHQRGIVSRDFFQNVCRQSQFEGLTDRQAQRRAVLRSSRSRWSTASPPPRLRSRCVQRTWPRRLRQSFNYRCFDRRNAGKSPCNCSDAIGHEVFHRRGRLELVLQCRSQILERLMVFADHKVLLCRQAMPYSITTAYFLADFSAWPCTLAGIASIGIKLLSCCHIFTHSSRFNQFIYT